MSGSREADSRPSEVPTEHGNHPGRPGHPATGPRLYVPGQGPATDVQPGQLQDLLKGQPFFWLDLGTSTDTSDRTLLDEVGIGEVSQEFLVSFGRPALIGRDENEAWMVLFAIQDADHPVEVHFVLTAHYVVTTRQRSFPPIDQLLTSPELGSGRSKGLASTPAVLHRIVDVIADSFISVFDQIDDDIDELQTAIFQDPSDDHLHALFDLKRSVVALRRLLTPQRDALSRLAGHVSTVPGWTHEDDFYFRVMYERFIRLTDLLDSYRDLLSGALDVYLSMVSNRLGEVTKQLTVIASVFLPLSFITGFFGQNFGVLVGGIAGWPAFLLLGIGVEAVAVLGFLVLFHRRGWIGNAARRRARKRRRLEALFQHRTHVRLQQLQSGHVHDHVSASDGHNHVAAFDGRATPSPTAATRPTHG